MLLIARDEASLAELAEHVRHSGAKATVVAADISREDDLQALESRVAEQPLDVLINNAGWAVVKPLPEITNEEWQQMLAVNVTAPFRLTRAAAARMPAGASIVNIGSIASRQVFPNWSAYCMSKHALDGFSRSVREEFREAGIRVINIYPAATNTGLWQQVPGVWPAERMLPPSEVADAIAYALARPGNVLATDIEVGNLSGTL